MTASGGRLSVYGQVMLNLKLGGYEFEHAFLLADIENDCILGVDFLSKYGCDVLLSKQKMVVRGQSITCFSCIADGDMNSSCKVVIQDKCTIPPSSEVIVKGCLTGTIPIQAVGVIEPRENFISKYGLMVAKVLVDPFRGSVPVRIMNLSDKPCTLYSHTVVGNFDEVNDSILQESIRRLDVLSEQDTGDALPVYLEELFKRSCVNLDQAHTGALKGLLLKYRDIFSKSAGDLGLTHLTQHCIDTGDTKPIKQHPRRIPLARREAAENDVRAMLEHGVIEPSTSAWCSPVCIVEKKGGDGIRFCIDYRKLNSVTNKDSQPLPRIDDTLDALVGAAWLSTVDLKSGYWQVPMRAEDKAKTTFSMLGGGF
ncbi:hypothetical protein SNE40_009297 [Patella caerulea]|uniref:Reverse transcriptase domain-containing protein n=1 Tax=Patella caerulea TaxID=87958 RepID=A0AAN8PY57_PATCE